MSSNIRNCIIHYKVHFSNIIFHYSLFINKKHRTNALLRKNTFVFSFI